VRASGGGRRPCARRLLIRSSLFPYSTVVGARALIDSLNVLSVFEAADVDDRMRDWVERRVGSLRAISLCTSVRIPLTHTLDTINRGGPYSFRRRALPIFGGPTSVNIPEA
jgi:hypothetical protein